MTEREFDRTPEEAYQEALRRIEEATKSREDKIDLSNLGLEELPAEIGQHTTLSYLNLTGNKLSSLPQEISQLANLTTLILWDNRITSIIPDIRKNTHLTTLDLDQNQLITVPSELKQLIYLNELYLNHNHLKTLPSWLKDLSTLTKLALYGNQFTSFPEEILHLSKLFELYIGGNQFASLPPEIGQLTNLTLLHLENNQLTSLPPEIQNLTKLENLYLMFNPDLNIPPEILEKDDEPQAILSYYFETAKAAERQETQKLMEAKVVLVGEGFVGKTSLVKRLVYNTFDPTEAKTDRIEITPWDVNTIKGDVHLRLWDFGGQDIMHPTHQFFLTERTLYLLVMDTRQSEAQNRLDYWLKIIASFGGEAPVILVGNKTDEHNLDINQKQFREKYPHIVGILGTSCKTGDGIKELCEAIAAQVAALEHIENELPQSWFNVKDQLEAQAQAEDYVRYEVYEGFCAEFGVDDPTSQRTLIGFLHDLGIVLNYRDERYTALPDTPILNPEWVTKGVYQIINDKSLIGLGEVDWPALREILTPPDYPSDTERRFIIEMMRKFELAFSIDGGGGERFLVPNLLTKEEPFVGDWENALSFVYQYDDVLPESLIARFIVRMREYIHRETVWRTGVILKKGRNGALVRADLAENTIRIWVKGKEETRRTFLSAIRHEVDVVNDRLKALNYTEQVPIPDTDPEVLYGLSDLLTLEREGIDTYFLPSVKKDISVTKLLSGYDLEKDRIDQLGDRVDKRLEEFEKNAMAEKKFLGITTTHWKYIGIFLGVALAIYLVFFSGFVIEEFTIFGIKFGAPTATPTPTPLPPTPTP